MHEALCRSSATTLVILHVERRAADHSANIGSSRPLKKSLAAADEDRVVAVVERKRNFERAVFGDFG